MYIILYICILRSIFFTSINHKTITDLRIFSPHFTWKSPWENPGNCYLRSISTEINPIVYVWIITLINLRANHWRYILLHVFFSLSLCVCVWILRMCGFWLWLDLEHSQLNMTKNRKFISMKIAQNTQKKSLSWHARIVQDLV